MQGGNLEILILGTSLAGIIIIITVMILMRALDTGRKQTKYKLDRFQARFGTNKQLKNSQARSIRSKEDRSGLSGKLAEMLPRQEQIERRIQKAGMATSLSKYATACGAIALGTLTILLLMGAPLVLAILISFIAGLGLPHIVVSRRIKARTTLFTKQFPEAIDLMVRGLKSGLPVNECISNVGVELLEPTGVEFQNISDAMRLGKQLEEALWDTAERLDTPDFKFFVISLVVQRETGGNLGETLGNLSTILRQRESMKLKIKSLSSEAKASAWIVGALPFVMLAFIMATNYDYGIVLFTHPKAIVIGMGGLIWMSLGVFIMSKMITFEV
ncbi:MAG: type II secretion system F family protein [Kordiimonadaceae bacterium]|nr:type II secretion system F family protein [Kordiimonadaceae bacterium]